MKTILPISCKTLSINTLIVVLCLVIYSNGVSATVRYVKPIASGSADGSSWLNASDDIQTMINASASTDSVWVAAGEYKPYSYPPGCLTCSDQRYYTFYIKDGVRLFGNFIGFETKLNQRDFGSNTTFLSGDFNNNDVINISVTNLQITGNEENVYHVIMVCDISEGNLPVTIDGFSIKGGNANAGLSYIVNGISVSRYHGGGIYVKNLSTTIANCFIHHNFAVAGSGIYSVAQNTIVNNNIIARNRVTTKGGGILIENTVSTISNNSFVGNYANNFGGSIYSSISETSITNNEINGNLAALDGGGIYLEEGVNSIFKNTFTNNYSVRYGGAICIEHGIDTIKDNIIRHNRVESYGGGIYVLFGYNWFINNIICNNSTEKLGGGIYVHGTVSSFTNNTITGNNADLNGGGIYVNDGSNFFRNNIFWHNLLDSEPDVPSADLFFNIGAALFENNMLQLDSMTYTIPFYIIGAGAQGNLFAQNPLFLNKDNPAGDDFDYFTEDDGLQLQTNSFAVNAGTLTGAPPTDILGTTRDTQPDIGAYEHGVVVGIQPNTNFNPTASLHAYPNPATDAITFSFTTPTTDHSTLLLYAIDGRNITSLYKGLTQAGETNMLTIDTNQFTPGTYCAVLRCGTGLAQHRTIVVSR